MNRPNPAHTVALTAMGMALVLAAQYLGGLIPAIAVIFGPFSVKQLITGTLVNAVLLVFTARAGLVSGAAIGILSALAAPLLGISQLAIAPLVALGNATLCAVYRPLSKRAHHLAAAAAGAALKCALLWLTVPPALHAAGFPPKQAAMLSVMFSWPQAVTALCGGFLSWPVLVRLKKAVK